MALTPDPKNADPFATIENLFCLIFFGKELAENEESTGAAGNGSGDGEEEEEEQQQQSGDKDGSRRRTKKDN